MCIIAIGALYKAVVKSIAHTEQDIYGQSTEGSKFINILPETTVVVLMLLGVGIVYRRYI